MKDVLRYLWKRRTTAFGYIQVILGALVTADGIFSTQALKWIILLNALLLAVLGHYNNRQQKQAA
jgi:hypothetical protein